MTVLDAALTLSLIINRLSGCDQANENSIAKLAVSTRSLSNTHDRLQPPARRPEGSYLIGYSCNYILNI